MTLQFDDDPVSNPAKPPTAPVVAPVANPRLKLAKVAVVAVLAGVVIFGLFFEVRRHTGGNLESVGVAYQKPLLHAYADAWDDGAKLLESGQSIAMALGTVKASWEHNRGESFAKFVTPKFNGIVPEDKNEKDVSPEDRKALAKAWREFAKGLRK